MKTISLCALLGCAAQLHAADLWVNAPAAAKGNGSRELPFQTIQAAAAVAQPGDTVRVLPGIYRERVMPARGGTEEHPIVYRSEVLHGAVVKGSDVWSPKWRDEGKGIFSATPDEKMFTDRDYVDGGNPYRIAYDWDKVRNNLPPFPYREVTWTLGQVFADGAPLKEMSSREQLTATPQSWWYDWRKKSILLNLGGNSPKHHTIELTTRRGVFRPKLKGLGYIELHGFVFEHCANQFPAQFWKLKENAQSGMVGTRGGHHWVIASNILRHAKSVGLTFGNSGGGKSVAKKFDNETDTTWGELPEVAGFHRIEGNLFELNGAIGAMGNSHRSVVFRGNIFSKNNSLANNAYEIGGIKTHSAHETLIEGNWFLDNDCMGIWLDNTWRNCRVTRNLFVGNRGKNIFVEMDDNTPATASTIDCNLFLDSRPTYVPQTSRTGTNTPGRSSPWAVGIYGHDADGVRIRNNLFAGPGYGLYFRKITKRKGGAANIEATANLFAGDTLTAACLPVENPPWVRGNFFDYNVYPAGARSLGETARPLTPALSVNPVAADVSPLHLNSPISQSRLTSAATVQGFTARTLIGGNLSPDEGQGENKRVQVGAFAATAWSQPDGSMDMKSFARLQSQFTNAIPPLRPFGRTNAPSGLYLNLDQWRTAMNFDSNSVAAPLRYEFDRATWSLTLTVPTNALPTIPASAAAGKDFFGAAFGDSIPVGPFANLQPGRQVIQLPAPNIFPAQQR